MPRLHRIAACLVIAAQVILSLAVPGAAVHGADLGHRHHDDSACGGHAVATDDRLVCRSPAGTLVLGLGGHGHSHGECDHGGFDCGDGHSHLHVANVDEVRDGSRRWMLPPMAECGLVAATADAGGGRGASSGPDRTDRVSRPPPSSRRVLGSIVLRV